MSVNVRIESVTTCDAKELRDIFAYYVDNTAVSFEYETPSVENFRERIENIKHRYPYIKAVDENGRILGYAYAGRFKIQAAYDAAVETTVYLRPECKGAGIGKALYDELERRLLDCGILNMNACIAAIPGSLDGQITAEAVPDVGDIIKKDLPEIPTDPYLTNDSIYFHEKMGFSMVGTFHKVGYKFGRWYDMVWMEKLIGEHV